MATFAQRFVAVVSVAGWACARAAGDEPLQLRLEPALTEAAAAQTEGRPVYGRADRADGRAQREISLYGDAELRRAGTVVRGDRITYYVPDDEVVAVGNVRIVREGSVFTGPELRLQLDSQEGVFTSPSFYLPLYGGRGRADEVEFSGGNRVTLRNALYTTCAAEDPDWYLRAESLTLDQAEQEGRGRSASLYFKDQRILAWPLFGYSLGEGRRSGFLAPTFLLTSKTGPELVTPYYWNIAPNRDFTLYPRFMPQRGIQLGGQFRFLETNQSGDVRAEYTPYDRKTETSRYFWSVRDNFYDVYGWYGSLNARGVSDDQYFIDYARSILASSERALPRDLLTTRRYGDWNLLFRVTSYQNILESRLTPPYERLPQVNATWVKRGLWGFDADAMLDATMWRQPLPNAPEGWRFVAQPHVSYPIQRPGWFVIPRAGIHLSSYQLDTNAGNPTNLSRAVPSFSFDSGLVFDRSVAWRGAQYTQTLEPRLFYVYVPYRDQSQFPVFDTTVADFNFTQLFSENTFVGNDRIANLNQLTLAAVSRLIQPADGGEPLRLALGQRFYFTPQKVTIPGVPARADTKSDILLAASAMLGAHARIDGAMQYSIADVAIPRVDVVGRYLPPDGRILNAGVRYQEGVLGQIDTSWRWPLAPRWMTMGRLNYSFIKEVNNAVTGSLVPAKPQVVEGVAGIEYIQDCWTLRLVGHYFLTAAGTATSEIFVQLELGGLGRIGIDPFDILRRNIPGYRLPTDRPPLPTRYFGYE